jgi:hypothetical protein
MGNDQSYVASALSRIESIANAPVPWKWKEKPHPYSTLQKTQLLWEVRRYYQCLQ